MTEALFPADALVVVIGAGTMGAGIAQAAAAAGHRVQVIDLDPAAADRGRVGIAKALDGLVKRGKLDAVGRDAIADRIRWSSDLADAQGGALAIEAIVERLDAKAGLFAKLAAIMGPMAILASNTSSLSITELGRGVDRPERFVGLHFFNPVPVMKLVEVVAGEATTSQCVDAMAALMRRWGKRPVVVRDVPGFIVNRVARPYYAEGFAAWGEGIDPATIDATLVGAGGFRMGPLALADLIGHDVNYAVATSVYDAYHAETRFRPQPAQHALVEAGRLGRKSGHGVYDYGVEQSAPPVEAPRAAPHTIVAPASVGLLEPLLAVAEAAGQAVERSGDVAQEQIGLDGLIVALGDGRPLAARPDVAILLDWARDFAAAPVLAFTARDDAAADVAIGFIQSLGRTALRLPDRPGQLVLRTLAQLANAAADAVADGVARADAIDEAMVFGANHPEGPLAWTARVGAERVAEMLDRISAAADDALYRASPTLRTGSEA